MFCIIINGAELKWMHIKVLQIVQLIYTKNSLLLGQSEHTEIYRDNCNSHYHGKMFSEIRKES